MEPSKIPKMGPSKIARPAIASKVLTSIAESGTSGTSNVIPNVTRRAVLSRRSKSASDLRTLANNSKATSTTKQPTTTTTTTAPGPSRAAPTNMKAGQKRSAVHKNQTENKAKIPKIKIPDWDYKSRFQDLQKKYAALQEDHEQSAAAIARAADLERDLENLQATSSQQQTLLDTFKMQEEIWRKEKQLLSSKNEDLEKSLLEIQETLRSLKEQHKMVVEENEAFAARLRILEDEFLESQGTATCLKEKCLHLEATIQQLRQELDEKDNLRRHLHNEIQDLKGNIRVFCRVRPPISDEEFDRLQCTIHFPTDASLEIRKSRESVGVAKQMDLKQEFHFDKVFPPEANQGEVFEELAQLVQSALDGYNVCVFAYGQTGSGKTHTMQGSSEDQGMIPRTIDLIFKSITKLTMAGWTYSVSVNFLEIYNENIRDLLVPDSTQHHELRFNEGRGVTVTNLKNVDVCSASELKNLMDKALRNRSVAATDFNEHSSRSHAITRISLKGANDSSEAKYSGSINLVDLAGSESAKTSTADRLAETKSINKSLSALGKVMLALHNNDSHLPYRDSKLTFLLQSCLGGNSKTLMFVNISPFEECFAESISSLRFASQVKEIKTNAKRNKAYSNLPVRPKLL